LRTPDRQLIGKCFDIEVSSSGDSPVYALFHQFDMPEVSTLTAPETAYLEVPEDEGEAENGFIPVRKTALVTTYGQCEVPIVCKVIGNNGEPLVDRQVLFHAADGYYRESLSSMIARQTDSTGTAVAFLHTRWLDPELVTASNIHVWVEIPSTGERLELFIPIENNQDRLLNLYFRDIPSGVTIRSGKYYLDPLAPICLYPGGYNNVQGILNFPRWLLTGSQDPSDHYVCGSYEGRILNWLNGLRVHPDTAYVLNGLEYGPIMTAGLFHVAVVLYEHNHPHTEGLILDAWINQTPEVYSWAEWSIKMLTPGYPDFNWIGSYPFTGGKYYPNAHSVSRTPEQQKNPGQSVFFFSPVNIRIMADSGGWIGLSGGEIVSSVDYSELARTPDHHWYAFLPAGGYDVEITGTENGTFSTAAFFQTGDMVQYTDVPIGLGEVANLRLDIAAPGSPIELSDGTLIQPDSPPSKLPVILAMDPLEGVQGQRLNISLTGDETHFLAGSSTASMGEGITIHTLDVLDETHAELEISIDEEMEPGPTFLAVTTGTETAFAIVDFEILLSN
jgi:hypothetical protein